MSTTAFCCFFFPFLLSRLRSSSMLVPLYLRELNCKSQGPVQSHGRRSSNGDQSVGDLNLGPTKNRNTHKVNHYEFKECTTRRLQQRSLSQGTQQKQRSPRVCPDTHYHSSSNSDQLSLHRHHYRSTAPQQRSFPFQPPQNQRKKNFTPAQSGTELILTRYSTQATRWR